MVENRDSRRSARLRLIECYAVGMSQSRTLGLFLLLASSAACASIAFPALLLQSATHKHFYVSPGSPGELLQTAIRDGNAQAVESLLASGADPNRPDTHGNPPLVQAAWNGNPAVIGLLLDHGANVNGRNAETGSTALLYAVLSGRETTVRLLLNRGAHVDFRYRDDQTVVHIAAAKGNTPVLATLISARPEINAVDQRDRTPLDEAILHNQLSSVLLLLRSGANVHRVHSLDGRGPLHEACIKGYPNLIRPLVEAGADPILPDRFSLTPLDLALDYKNENVVATLLHLGMRSEALQKAAGNAMERAALRGQTEIAKLLVQGGLPLNERTSAGSTYLSDAALKGKKDVVQLLLDHGADVNAANQTGGTPLHDAALSGNPEIIKLLLDHGARIDAQDQESAATPLMMAASLGRSQAVAILLQRGANANLRDRYGRTALDRARQLEDPAIIRLLETGIGAHSGSSGSQNG